MCCKSEVIMAPNDRFAGEEWRPAVKAIIRLRLHCIDFHLLLIAKTRRYGPACRLTIDCRFNRILLVNFAKYSKSKACLYSLYSQVLETTRNDQVLIVKHLNTARHHLVRCRLHPLIKTSSKKIFKVDILDIGFMFHSHLLALKNANMMFPEFCGKRNSKGLKAEK